MFICEVIGRGLGNLAILLSFPLVTLQKQTCKSQNTQGLYYWLDFIVWGRYETRISDPACAVCEVSSMERQVGVFVV